MTKLQKAIINYQSALLDLKAAEKTRVDFERNYIIENNITNADGTYPECFPQIDCNVTFMRIVGYWLDTGGELNTNEEYRNLAKAVSDTQWEVRRTEWQAYNTYLDTLQDDKRNNVIAMYGQSHETRAEVIQLALNAA